MRTALIVLLLLFSSRVVAHDTWVETNTNLVRVDDAVHVDLKLGNHGNGHRDFKLASKIDIEKCTLAVITPEGQNVDLKEHVVDTGYAPKEGYWTAKFVPAKPGMYTVAHTLNTLHKTTRAIKSGKTYFIASKSLDKVPANNSGFDKPLGHPLELVAKTDPITPVGPGTPISVCILYQGKPLPKARVTFIPRGSVLTEGFDEKYERWSDENGCATFTPSEGNVVLAVVHHAEPDQKGDGYDRTSYSATLTVYVPEQCPCCE